MGSLLYENTYKINDFININIPTVIEVLKQEDEYNSLVFILTAMPIDMMVFLDDAGIDFASINEYDLFLLMFEALKRQDTSLIFGSLDLSKFKETIDPENGNRVLYDFEHGIKIDRSIHYQIANALRKINHIERNVRKPANKEAREFMLMRARAKMRRNKNRKNESQIEPLIVAMVNTEEYKYDFETTKDLTIYQFNECVQQIVRKVNYNNKMTGVYTGSISAKDLNPNEFNWLTRK